MTRTVIFVGSVSKGVLEYFSNMGYTVGFFQEKPDFKKTEKDNRKSHDARLDFVVPIDFTSQKTIQASVKNFYYKPDTILFCSKDRYILPLAYLADALNLNQKSFLPLKMVKQATSKILQRSQFVKTHPEITPKYKKVRTFHSAYMFARKYGFPLITKPSNLSQSQLVNRSDNLEDLIKVVSYSLDHISEIYKRNKIYRIPNLLIEEFVPGKLYSIDSYVSQDGKIHHTKPCREFMGGEFGFPEASIPVSAYLEDFSEVGEEKMYETVTKAIESLDIKGNVVHTEVKIDGPDNCQVIELNLRGGGFRASMLKESYSVDHNKNIVSAVLGENIEVKSDLKKYSAYVKLSPKKVGILREIKNLDMMESSSICKTLAVDAKPGDETGPLNHGYPFVVKAIYVSDDKDQMLKEIHDAMEKVEFLVEETEKGEETEF
jgi:hypothetical protein